MSEVNSKQFSDRIWLEENDFAALSMIADLLTLEENKGRECLIRLLEHRHIFDKYAAIVDDLIQRSGLFPYLSGNHENLNEFDLISLEFHKPLGMEDIVLHSSQSKIYLALMDGANVILSAPTSFGKSLLIDAAISSNRYSEIVIIVPTIALIDETRRRLTKRFHTHFKIITHPSQEVSTNNIYVLTQERFIEFQNSITPDFFVIDEFYKLSPNRGDERTFVLNHAFYRLLKSSSQFFMIGPNIQDIAIDNTQLNFRYYRTDFTTVATEVSYFYGQNILEQTLEICSSLNDPTLIFCKSAASAYNLAQSLIENSITSVDENLEEFSNWLSVNYHPDWVFSKYLKNGVSIHHAGLPRSVAYHVLRKFNEGRIKYLLCTSTIIEGVNTSAKNIVIYDNKIANTKFDQFTFNNIKGRSGRMFKYFVGHVYVLDYDPQEELPLVDVPSITQTPETPESLLIQMDDYDLSEKSKERLKYIHTQNMLPVEIIKANSGIEPLSQIDLATEIQAKLNRYHKLLSWNRYPTWDQLLATCELIYDFLMKKKGRDGVFSGKQLCFKINRVAKLKNVELLINEELKSDDNNVSKIIEDVFLFLRRWCEHHFPNLLTAINNIQISVFSRNGLQPGNYTFYGQSVKQLFMPLAATVLEEYGIPFQLTLKLESAKNLGENVDEILKTIHEVKNSNLNLTKFENEIFAEATEHI